MPEFTFSFVIQVSSSQIKLGHQEYKDDSKRVFLHILQNNILHSNKMYQENGGKIPLQSFFNRFVNTSVWQRPKGKHKIH